MYIALKIGIVTFIAIILLAIIKLIINKFKVIIYINNSSTHRPFVVRNNSITPSTHTIKRYPREYAGASRQLPERHNNIYYFPKCSICRCQNFEGQPQKVFWDVGLQKYYCRNGHFFT